MAIGMQKWLLFTGKHFWNRSAVKRGGSRICRVKCGHGKFRYWSTYASNQKCNGCLFSCLKEKDFLKGTAKCRMRLKYMILQ